MTRSVTLEICANSVTSALAAQQGGATRVELCENLKDAGTTPSFGQIQLTRKLIDIQLNVLIRPRTGDFLYTDIEFETMQADIAHCINSGCDGVVIGILKADGCIDKERCAQLVGQAKSKGLSVTFHRAFDLCADFYQALEDVIEIGCDRILTSGGKTTAMEGAGIIAHLVEKAAGRIHIMAGSGVNETNVSHLIRFTGVNEIHTSAKVAIPSGMHFQNDHIMMGNKLYDYDRTSADKVRKILELANATSSL